MTTDVQRWTIATQTAPAEAHQQRWTAGRVRRNLRFARRQPLGVLGGVILLGIISAAALAPVIAPYGPTAFLPYGPDAEPGPGAVLGTDQLGRDLLTRILYGARTSLLIAATATVIGIGLGSANGLSSRYLGGRVDMLTQRALDVWDALARDDNLVKLDVGTGQFTLDRNAINQLTTGGAGAIRTGPVARDWLPGPLRDGVALRQRRRLSITPSGRRPSLHSDAEEMREPPLSHIPLRQRKGTRS